MRSWSEVRGRRVLVRVEESDAAEAARKLNADMVCAVEEYTRAHGGQFIVAWERLQDGSVTGSVFDRYGKSAGLPAIENAVAEKLRARGHAPQKATEGDITASGWKPDK